MFGFFKNKLLRTAFLASSLTLVACGGGGSSTSSSSLTDTTARLTVDNAEAFADIVELSYFTSYVFLGARASTPAEAPAPAANNIQKVTRILRGIALGTASNSSQARTIDSTEACSGGGTVTTTGTLDDATDTGILTITMNYCVEEGVTLNGSSVVTITTNTVNQFVASITFNSLLVDDGSDTLVLRGTQDINETSNQVTITSNLNFTVNSTVEVEQRQLIVTENNAGVTVSGAVCIGDVGCVSIETVAPIQVDVYGYPVSGEIILHGMDSNLRIVLVDGEAYLYLDVNGDGTFETALTTGA